MGWSDIPSDLLIIIAETLTEITDQIRFSCVCSHWRSAFRSLPLPPQLPWLLHPSTSNSTGHFYSLSEDRIYPLPLPLSVERSSRLFGSASGWLLAVKEQNTYSMMNPFTGSSIHLPCLELESPLFDLTIDNLIWDRSDSVVVVACRGMMVMFYCHLGDDIQCWKHVESMQNNATLSITFYESKFYILNTWKIIILDGDTMKEILVIDSGRNWIGTSLIISSGGSLLLVDRVSSPSFFGFYTIYVMDLNKELTWAKVDNIGDYAIFIDDLHGFSVDINGRNNLRRNCIYKMNRIGVFNTEYRVDVFDLGNKRAEPVVLSEFCNELPQGKFRPPTWILPSLH